MTTQAFVFPGGQRGRISILRAFLKNAPILTFDEATSTLDNVAKGDVQQAMETLAKGRMTLIVAHLVSTLVNADKIIVLVTGAIVEFGTHVELVAAQGGYAHLYNLKFKN